MILDPDTLLRFLTASGSFYCITIDAVRVGELTAGGENDLRGHVHVMSARGEGGGTSKADAVRKLSKGGCVKMQTRG